MASSDGVPVDQLLSWTLASHYCARARTQHGVVEYSENELLNVQEEVEENQVKPWTPPPIPHINVTKLVAHIRSGGRTKWENDHWTLADPPTSGNSDEEAGPSK